MGFEDRDYSRQRPWRRSVQIFDDHDFDCDQCNCVCAGHVFTGNQKSGNWRCLGSRANQIPRAEHALLVLALDLDDAWICSRLDRLRNWFLRPIEQRLGRWEFLKFYLLAILAGGAGFYLVNLLSGWPLSSVLGASGAVSGVVALFIFYYPRQTLLIWGVLPVPAWLLGVIMLLTNLKYALVPGSGISWEAHLAGAAFGLAYFWFGWNFSRLKMPQSIVSKMSGSGALKIHNPDGRNSNEKLTQQADAILEKINLQGEDSLTGRERKLLKRYSEMVRQQRQ